MELRDESTNCKLRLTSKRLKSGKVQVKFSVSDTAKGEKYGYLLTEPRTSLKDVVNEIVLRYNNNKAQIHHAHLFKIGKMEQRRELILY